MISRGLLLGAAAVVLSCGGSGAAKAQTEIQWWHAMGGKLGETVNELADGFNKSQNEYKVVPVYKGSYTETLTAAIAAFRAKQGPHIVQVFEVGTADMMAAKGAVYPVYQLMADAKEPFDPKAYLRAGLRLLLDDRRQAAVDAVQLLDPGVLLEQGRLQEGGPRSRQAAEDLAGDRARWPRSCSPPAPSAASRRQWQTWIHDRELRRLAQPAVRHQGQRLRRHRHRAQVQRSAARQVSSRCWPTGARTRASSMAAARVSRTR